MGLLWSKPNLPNDKKVVIIGAGYGGSILGVALMKQNSSVTVIDVKDSFYHCVGAVRAVVEPDFMSKLLISYEKTFGSRFKQGMVVSIDPDRKIVLLKSGEEIEYDILIISTGSKGYYPFRTKVEICDSESVIGPCKEYVEKVKESKHFVVIGGGAVGCEVACELVTDLQDVDVTLIHPTEHLVTDKFGSGFQESLKSKMESKGVKLVLNEKVVEGLEETGVYGPCEIVTNKGNRFKADVVFRCTGGKPNSQAYIESLKAAVNENGALQVNEFLQVKGFNDIFALGDCNDVKEMKMAYRAGEQLKVLLPNINALYNGGQLTAYDPDAVTFGIGLSLGRNDSIAVTVGGYSIPSFLITWYKSTDLLVGRYWSEMQQTMPS